MDLSLIRNSSRQLSKTLMHNSPTILTALGVTGLVSTIVAAIKATPLAEEALYQEANFRMKEYSEQTGESEESYPTDVFTPVEIVELTWKFYIPTAVLGTLTIGCMIGANNINLRRNAALASVFSLTETALKEYQSKVVEVIGDKKEEKIRGEIAQDKLNANPVKNNAIIVTNDGSTLCYDSLSGRYFKSNIDKIKSVTNEFNRRLLSDMAISLNEFYDDIGLEPIEMGTHMGWTIEKGMVDLYFGAKLTPDGQPCAVLEHRKLPINIF